MVGVMALLWVAAPACGGDQPALPVSAAPSQRSHGELVVNRLIYGSSPKRALVRVRLSGKRTVLQTSPAEPVLDRSSWSPDGRAIVFTAHERPQGGSELSDGTDLYVIRTDGRRVRRLTHLKAASDPLWAPDGRSIVFSLTRRSVGGTASRHLMRVGVDGQGLVQVTAPVENPMARCCDDSAGAARGPGLHPPA